MTITDPADKPPTRRFPNLRDLKWPIVQALREIGEDATRAEIAARVADILGLAPQERAGTIPSGENRLTHHVGWACFELKKVGVLHYPERGRRALTPLGLEVDEERIHELPAMHESDTSPSAVWLIRAGGSGERYGYNIEHGRVGVGFGGKPDLRTLSSKEELTAALRSNSPDDGDRSISSSAGQLWRLRTEVAAGDLVIMPSDSQIALGTVTREYWYEPDREDEQCHLLSVDWQRVDVPRSTLREDLKKALRPRTTISTIARNDTARRFQYLMETGEDPGPPATPDDDLPSLGELATELLTDVGFLGDIVSLLEDKGQVILYGPPGTGKTYLARELAKALAPDESCRSLVQFHPSTSYEDFFEGYRPAGTGDGGGIAYELAPGPLARMAERASEAPDQRHVMIIDEINRGNLPRVLGELLFLLEYRDESVSTLYRPEEPFSLPENLWFIGTMNTADRSIALVDAALRRRFHFVPFFPDSGPMAGLLDRWLEREGEPDWVGSLVEAVNGELKAELEGSHLLLGPSHFMKEYGPSLDGQRERLRRIWRYNIEPFIEDQFFGDPNQIHRFRFNQVMNRHGPPTQSEPPEPEEDQMEAGT